MALAVTTGGRRPAPPSERAHCNLGGFWGGGTGWAAPTLPFAAIVATAEEGVVVAAKTGRRRPDASDVWPQSWGWPAVATAGGRVPPPPSQY